MALFYAGILALSVAWLGLGGRALALRTVWIIAAMWCLPLFLGPPLLSLIR